MGVVLPGGHHHSEKGVCTKDFEDPGSWSFEVSRSTRDRYLIPGISNSGASASLENDGLLAFVHGILILTDPVFQGPPAIRDSAPNLSRRRSSVAALNPTRSSGTIFPEDISFVIAFIPSMLLEDGLRQNVLMASKYESFLKGWRRGGCVILGMSRFWVLLSWDPEENTRQTRNLLRVEQCGDGADISGVCSASGCMIARGSIRLSKTASLTWGTVVTGE